MHRLFRLLFPPLPAGDPLDPFAHPDIRAMSLRALADLPLPRPGR